MDYLKELVKENMDFVKSNFNDEEMSDEELFDVVMENVESMVECYRYVDYVKEEK
jgi:hypothetical protein